MKYIKLIDSSKAIESAVFKEIYLSRFSLLEDTLAYLDRVCIEADVTFTGKVTGERMITTVEVLCQDEGFKQVIEEATRSFNSALVPSNK
jgi:hypothetical protein